MPNDLQSDLPPLPGSELVIKNAETAPAFWMVDVLWLVLADGRDTDGRLSLMEQLLPQGSGPGPHKHTWSDETFYMLDGQITLLVGGEIRTAPMISRHHQKRTRRPRRTLTFKEKLLCRSRSFVRCGTASYNTSSSLSKTGVSPATPRPSRRPSTTPCSCFGG